VLYFGYFTQALNITGTLLILLMAMSVNLDVGGRNLFNQPIPGVNEFIQPHGQLERQPAFQTVAPGLLGVPLEPHQPPS
jgi:hypothetical protein